MKIYQCIALAALTLGTLTTQAQRIKGGAGFIKVGGAVTSGAGTVLDQIAPAGVSNFTDQFYLLGGEGYYRTGNLILGLDGSVGAQTARSSGNSYGEGYTFYGHAKVGLVVNQGARYWIYPTVGLGSSTLGMTTYTKSGGETQDRLNRMIFRPSLDVGLNADWLLAKSRTTDQRFGGLLLGLRAGYHVSSAGNDWRTDGNNSLPNLPTYTNKGYYLMLTIGGGGFARK